MTWVSGLRDTWNKPVIKALFYLLLVLLTPVISAQQTETPETGQEAAVPEAGDTRAASDGQAAQSARPPAAAQAPADSFTPTETISEDLSVPFPVDI
jgi:hypothetical protein